MSGHPHHKLKSGCKTCRLRKVKCDQGWPACGRCQSSGRTCEGYGVWGGGSQALSLRTSQGKFRATDNLLQKGSTDANLNLPKTMPLLVLNTKEKECFEWFTSRSAVKLPGAFFSQASAAVWFQVFVNEPSIRHATLALSSVHQDEVQRSKSDLLRRDHNDAETLFSLRQYNLAITSLQPCFADSRRSSLRLVLLSCALFVWMEQLRGNYAKAIVHLEHGLSLLQGDAGAAQYQDPESMYVEGWLLTAFTRVLVQAKLLGQPLNISCQKFFSPYLRSNLGVFTSVHQARRSLENIMLRTFGLQEELSQRALATKDEIDSDMLNRRHRIVMELQTWSRIHESTISKLPAEEQKIVHFAHRLLGLYYNLTTILTDTCLAISDELEFDRSQSIFLDIITQCIDIYKIAFLINSNKASAFRTHHDRSSYGSSVSDIGWIAPLYFTAIKCRNHRIRHQAVQLLQSELHREGIWDAALAVAVAQKVIEIEEGNFYDQVKSEDRYFDRLATPTYEQLSTPVLPANFRLKGINITLPDNKTGKLLLRCYRLQGMAEIECIRQEYHLISREWYDIDRST